MRISIQPSLLSSSIYSMAYPLMLIPMMVRSFESPALILVLAIVLAQVSNYFWYRSARELDISADDNMLIVGSGRRRVWPKHKNRWLSWLLWDVIEFEQMSYQPAKKRHLASYYYTRKDWALLKATCYEEAPASKN